MSTSTPANTEEETAAADPNRNKICAACGQPGENLLCCARCKQAHYCGKKCQLDHFPYHKAKCRQIEEAAAATDGGGGEAAAAAATTTTSRRNIPDFETIDSSEQKTFADGIQVIQTDHLGKACIATRAFSTGDTVLLEPPAIVFDEREGYAGLFHAFLHAQPITQQRILKMYRPTDAKIEEHLDDKRKAFRVKRKQLLVHQYNQFLQDNPDQKDELPFELAEQLIGVVDANAHAFQAHHTIDIVSTSTNDAVPPTYHALFSLGSRVEHSCSPNLTFITKGGKLEYIAEMDIKPQDRLSISYLGGVYERPRKQRRGFLKENKVFLCKCVRCLGWDECSPLRCDCHQGEGVMFHSGSRNQFECQLCDKKIPAKEASSDPHIRDQLRGELQLFSKIRKYQLIFERSPYPEMLEEIIEVVKSPEWLQFIHPLHWLNVEVYKLLSSVAASTARYYVKDNGMPPTDEQVSSLLRLSALSTLRRIIWCERTVAVDRGLLPLTEAMKASSETFEAFSHKLVPYEHVEIVMEELCSNNLLGNLGTLGVSPAFHAGQDLILADHKDLALKLYKRFDVPFQHWKGLSDDSRRKIRAFLDSNGDDNQFGNFLLL